MLLLLLLLLILPLYFISIIKLFSTHEFYLFSRSSPHRTWEGREGTSDCVVLSCQLGLNYANTVDINNKTKQRNIECNAFLEMLIPVHIIGSSLGTQTKIKWLLI